MTDFKVNEVASNTIGKIEIKYTRPKFIRRVLAGLVDLFIFVLVALGIFMGVRGIVNNTPEVQAITKELNGYRIESGLYVLRDDTYIDVISYLNSDSSITQVAKINKCKSAIEKFFTFEQGKIESDRYNEILNQYREDQLSAVSDGHHLFVLNGTEIIENNVESDAEYFLTHRYVYYDFYKSKIDNVFQGVFVTTPLIYDLTKQINNYLIWLEIPVAYVSAVILVYFLPTIIFARNRYTIGKALYRIGSVDPSYLQVSFLRNLAKWSLFLLEMILGVASCGLIFICSFTLMAFSKKKQGFPDYVTNIQEVDCSKNKIYKNMLEIELEKVHTNKRPTDFKMINYD